MIKILSVAASVWIAGWAAGQSPDVKRDRVVAIVAGKEITEQMAEHLAGPRLIRARTEEYALQMSALRNYADGEVLKSEADQRHLSVPELLRVEVRDQVTDLTPQEAHTLYEGDQRYSNREEQEAVQFIRESMRRQRELQRREEYLATLRAKWGFKSYMKSPRFNEDLVRGSETRGLADAPITIVAFSDFQCPYCMNVPSLVKRLDNELPNSVRFVFRHFPLAMHRDAIHLAQVAACAGEQGQFWDMHDALFRNPIGPADEVQNEVKKHVRALGLQQDQFEQCMVSKRPIQRIKQDQDDAIRLGINGTPTLFVNGRLVLGGASYREIRQIIAEEMQAAAAAHGEVGQ